VLGVFGLSPTTTRRDLEDEFGRLPGFDHVELIIDRHTMDSKCFAFVYFTSVDHAAKAKEGLVGMKLDGRTLRVDYSFTKKPHSPTPGKYLGRAAQHRPFPPTTTNTFRPYTRYPSTFDRGGYGRRSPPARRDYYDDRGTNYDTRDRGSYERYDSRFDGRFDRYERPYPPYEQRTYERSYDSRPPYSEYGRRPYR